MKNCIVKSSLLSSGESVVFTSKGEISTKGNFTRICYSYNSGESMVNSEIILLQSNSIKLKVNGDSSYSVTLVEGESSAFSINVSGYVLNSEIFTEKIKIDKQELSLNLLLEYYVLLGGEKNKTTLNLQVEYEN